MKNHRACKFRYIDWMQLTACLLLVYQAFPKTPCKDVAYALAYVIVIFILIPTLLPKLILTFQRTGSAK